MQLDLTRFRQPVGHFSRTFQPEEVAPPQPGADGGQEGDVYRIAAPVTLAFEVHKDKDRFRLVGSAQTELELHCSRCLEPFRLPVNAAFDLRYHPMSEASGDEEREVEEDDLDTSYYDDDQIDLNELLREQFYLALPMKPLCGEACKGLCTHCGANLNTGTCGCGPAWEDPRLAPLNQLKRERRT
jgi:uncharacterized protein